MWEYEKTKPYGYNRSQKKWTNQDSFFTDARTLERVDILSVSLKNIEDVSICVK